MGSSSSPVQTQRRTWRSLQRPLVAVLLLTALVMLPKKSSSSTTISRLVEEREDQETPSIIMQKEYTETIQEAFDAKDEVSPMSSWREEASNTTEPILYQPEEAFEAWKAKHSVEALQAEVLNRPENMATRKFMLARLSCPDRAGNFLNYFTYDMTIAILTNRTLLYFHQTEAANEEGSASWNTKEACDRVLTVSPWLPLLNDWKDVYNLSIDERDTLSQSRYVFKAYKKKVDKKKNLRLDPLVNQSDTIVKEAVSLYIVSKKYEMWFHDLLLDDPVVYKIIASMWGFISDTRAAHVKTLLMANGHAFLRGMLFSKAFQIAPEIIDSVRAYTQKSSNAFAEANHLKFGIHSRHQEPGDDGRDVSREIKCMKKLLQFHREKSNDGGGGGNETQPCTIYVMTDRPKTIGKLDRAARRQGCSMINVQSGISVNTTGLTEVQKEHGVFAGSGFFKDFVVLSSQVKSGFVHSAGFATGSSSSALVWQQIVYNRIKEGTLDAPPPDCGKLQGKVRFHGQLTSN